MLMTVVGLIDGAHHLLLTVVDGYDRQVVERCLRWLAPEDISALLLQLPVAEGADDMLVLQSLRLMNREDAYAAGLVALNGLRAEGLIPLVKEGGDVGGTLVDEVDEVVVEGTDIGTLAWQILETKDGIEALSQVVERQRAQVIEMTDIGFGQQFVEVGSREHLDAVALIILQDIGVVTLDDGGFRQLVGGMNQQAHGIDQHADSAGGIEAEGLVGDDGHLGHLFHEVLGDEGDDGVGTYENGYLFLCRASS